MLPRLLLALFLRLAKLNLADLEDVFGRLGRFLALVGQTYLSVITSIATGPTRFVNNLLEGVGAGLEAFGAKVGEFFLEGALGGCSAGWAGPGRRGAGWGRCRSTWCGCWG